MTDVAAIIVAAGRGTRAGTTGRAKQYVALSGRPVLHRTLTPFVTSPRVNRVLVVIHPDDRDHYVNAIADHAPHLMAPVEGGPTRQASVLAGLQALSVTPPDLVLIHDAARPFVSPNDIDRVIDALATAEGAICALPVVDTLKRAQVQTNDTPTVIFETVERANLWRALTPQGFHFDAILKAHDHAHQMGQTDFTDDASIAEASGITVALVQGDARNTKLTTPADFVFAEQLMTQHSREVRTGTGYDVHAFAPGDHVWLCGVKIPHTQALKGHSDADVGLHALTDALYGAIADGDIGAHFPPSDPQWKGAPSHIFLAHAGSRISEQRAVIINLDITLVCEAPKIGPHRDSMRKTIADILNIDVARVAVKATTSEQLGFTGRREGIAAIATANVSMLPPPGTYQASDD